MRYLDGTLVIADPRRNGPILTVETETGAVSVTTLRFGPDVDFTEVELLAGDPEHIWLEVRRMTFDDDDNTGLFASGPTTSSGSIRLPQRSTSRYPPRSCSSKRLSLSAAPQCRRARRTHWSPASPRAVRPGW